MSPAKRPHEDDAVGEHRPDVLEPYDLSQATPIDDSCSKRASFSPLVSFPGHEAPLNERWPEAQQAFLTLTANGTSIPVQVDYAEASKKANERRQRNMKAAARFRRKKKIKREEDDKELLELRDEKHQMELKIDKLMQKLDFYREERDRLRGIISQTPSISHLACGSPSPTSTRRGSYTETTPPMICTDSPISHLGSGQPEASTGYNFFQSADLGHYQAPVASRPLSRSSSFGSMASGASYPPRAERGGKRIVPIRYSNLTNR